MKITHQTKHNQRHRDLSLSTLSLIIPALLLTTSVSLAQDNNDATKLPGFKHYPLCSEPDSTYNCLNQDPTITESWEHLSSDDTDPNDEESEDRHKGKLGTHNKRRAVQTDDSQE